MWVNLTTEQMKLLRVTLLPMTVAPAKELGELLDAKIDDAENPAVKSLAEECAVAVQQKYHRLSDGDLDMDDEPPSSCSRRPPGTWPGSG